MTPHTKHCKRLAHGLPLHRWSAQKNILHVVAGRLWIHGVATNSNVSELVLSWRPQKKHESKLSLQRSLFWTWALCFSMTQPFWYACALGTKDLCICAKVFWRRLQKRKVMPTYEFKSLRAGFYHQPIVCIYIYITYIIHLYITAMNIVYIYISCSRYVSTRPFVWGGDFVLPAVMLKMIR